MLKFRVTNSMRARRAAEAQRKALEEKLQLEWAWKPMAAMMNEKQTDLVYWIPPLYRNNIKTAGSRVRRKNRASVNRASVNRSTLNRASVNRRTLNRLPYTQLQAAQMISELHATERKRKLARRRSKLASEISLELGTDTESLARPRNRKSRVVREISLEDPTDTDSISRFRRRSKLGQRVSFENATDTDSAVLDSRSDSKCEWHDAKDEDIESGIHDETTDYNADELSLHTVRSIQEEEDRHTGATMKRRLGEHRRAHRSGAIKPKVPPKPDFITKSFEAIDKPKPAPTLIRLLEKVSHIHSPSVKPIKPIKPELRKINRRGSESKSSIKGKVRRPSVKVYGNAPNRLSSRRSKGMDDPVDLESQCVIVSVDNEALKSPQAKAAPKQSPKPVTKLSTKSSPKPTKTSSKSGIKSSTKAAPKCLSKASLKNLPKELQKESSKDMPKTPVKEPFGILKDPFGSMKDKEPFGILKDAPVKPEEAEFRNAQLQMILRLLAQLYEEKVSRQDAEIQNMKARIQTQDKLMKQMAHVVLELKEEISRVKVIATGGHPPEVPSNVLNIKVGET